jgi:hypothetical protein
MLNLRDRLAPTGPGWIFPGWALLFRGSVRSSQPQQDGDALHQQRTGHTGPFGVDVVVEHRLKAELHVMESGYDQRHQGGCHYRAGRPSSHCFMRPANQVDH